MRHDGLVTQKRREEQEETGANYINLLKNEMLPTFIEGFGKPYNKEKGQQMQCRVFGV